MKTILSLTYLLLLLSGNCPAQDSDNIKIEVLAKSISSWDKTELPEYANGQPEITILKVTIPPKEQLPPHKHPVINAGVLLKGQLTVVTEEMDTLHLKAGDPIVEVINKWHHGKNEGNEPAEIIVFYAGIKDRPITIRR